MVPEKVKLIFLMHSFFTEIMSTVIQGGVPAVAAVNTLYGHLPRVEVDVYSGVRCLLKNAVVLNKIWYK